MRVPDHRAGRNPHRSDGEGSGLLVSPREPPDLDGNGQRRRRRAACRRTVGPGRHHRHGDGRPLERRGHRRDRPRHDPADRGQRTGHRCVWLREGHEAGRGARPRGSDRHPHAPRRARRHRRLRPAAPVRRRRQRSTSDCGRSRRARRRSTTRPTATTSTRGRSSTASRTSSTATTARTTTCVRTARSRPTPAPRRPRSRATAATTGSTTCPRDQYYKQHQPRGVLRQRGRRQEGRLPSRPGLSPPVARAARHSIPNNKRQPPWHSRNDPARRAGSARVDQAAWRGRIDWTRRKPPATRRPLSARADPGPARPEPNATTGRPPAKAKDKEMHQGPAGEGGWPGPDRPRICWTAPGQRRPVKGREHDDRFRPAQRALCGRVTPVEGLFPGANGPVWTTDTHHGV